MARSNVFLEADRDALGEELTSPDISRREVEQDKRLVKLINNACKEDQSARAIELVNQLHHLQTFDGAIKIAGFYRLVGLREKIEAIKLEREGNDRLEGQRERRRELVAQQAPIPKPSRRGGNMSPPPDPNRPRPLEDFRPPPTMHRPGLAPAIPVLATTKYSAANLPPRGVSNAGSSTPPEIKRKRDGDDEVSQKRPALETESISSKPSECDVMMILKKSQSSLQRITHSLAKLAKRQNIPLHEKWTLKPSRRVKAFLIKSTQPKMKPGNVC